MSESNTSIVMACHQKFMRPQQKKRTPAGRQGSFRGASGVLAADADEDRAGANVHAEERSGSAVPAAVDGHAVADVYSDVGQAHAAVLVVGEVARPGLSGADGAAEGQVAGRPAVVVDADGGECVGGQRGAVLGNTELGVGSSSDCCTLAARGSGLRCS